MKNLSRRSTLAVTLTAALTLIPLAAALAVDGDPTPTSVTTTGDTPPDASLAFSAMDVVGPLTGFQIGAPATVVVQIVDGDGAVNTAATGPVEATDAAGNVVGSGEVVDGVATLEVTLLTAGADRIEVAYLGSETIAGCTGGLDVVVGKQGTWITAVGPAKSPRGAVVPLKVAIGTAGSGEGSITGEVTVTPSIGDPVTVTVDGERAIVMRKPTVTGVVTYTVTLAPTDEREGASTTVSVTVTKVSSSTHLSVGGKKRAGSPITATVRVTGANHASVTGTVTILDAGQVVGESTLVRGVAKIQITLPAGTHTLTAVYAGSSTVAASHSKAVKVKAEKAKGKADKAEKAKAPKGKAAKHAKHDDGQDPADEQ